MTELPEDDGAKKDEIIFELVKKLYDDGFETKRTLDDKGSNLIGYVTIVTGLLIGLGTFEILDKLTLPQYYVPYFLGIALFLATIVFSMFAVKVTKYEFVPTVSELRKVLNEENWKHRTVMRQFITGAMNSIENNYTKNERKAMLISFSWYCLIAGLIFVTVYTSIVITNLKP